LNLLAAVLLAVSGSAARAADPPACASALPGSLLASAIGIEADPSLPPGVLEAALASWRHCPTAGTGFPEFTAPVASRSAVRVRYVAGNSGELRCGTFAGEEIVLFASAVDRARHPVPCGSLAENLAHELGHVLGLLDAPAVASCRTFIMAPADFRPGHARQVQPQECAAADSHWRTESEGAVLANAWRRLGDGFMPVESEAIAAATSPASLDVDAVGALPTRGGAPFSAIRPRLPFDGDPF
jgi:hypothetical protein